MKEPTSVADWTPPMPTSDIKSLLEPNAKDGPEVCSATNDLSPTKGGSGKMSDPAPRGKEF